MSDFGQDLTDLINRHSLENHSDTPDYILAQFMITCLEAFNQGVADRAHQAGVTTAASSSSEPSDTSKNAPSEEL